MKLRPLRHRSAGRAIASLPGAATRPAIARLATTRPSAAAYVVVAATTSLGALLPDDRLHAVTKHLVAPLAALDVATRPGAWTPRRRPTTGTLLVALTGSAIGDHLMLAESRSEGAAARRHLRRGAAAFGVQQLGLLTVMRTRGQRFTPRAIAVGVTTLAALAVVDHVAARRDSVSSIVPDDSAPSAAHNPDAARVQPRAAEPRTPDAPSSALPDPVVATYGALLVAMAMLAQDDARTARGGAIFLTSDALIVTRQLLPHSRLRRVADTAVMATYTAALAMLVDALAADDITPARCHRG